MEGGGGIERKPQKSDTCGARGARLSGLDNGAGESGKSRVRHLDDLKKAKSSVLWAESRWRAGRSSSSYNVEKKRKGGRVELVFDADVNHTMYVFTRAIPGIYPPCAAFFFCCCFFILNSQLFNKKEDSLYLSASGNLKAPMEKLGGLRALLRGPKWWPNDAALSHGWGFFLSCLPCQRLTWSGYGLIKKQTFFFLNKQAATMTQSLTGNDLMQKEKSSATALLGDSQAVLSKFY